MSAFAALGFAEENEGAVRENGDGVQEKRRSNGGSALAVEIDLAPDSTPGSTPVTSVREASIVPLHGRIETRRHGGPPVRHEGKEAATAPTASPLAGVSTTGRSTTRGVRSGNPMFSVPEMMRAQSHSTMAHGARGDSSATGKPRKGFDPEVLTGILALKDLLNMTREERAEKERERFVEERRVRYFGKAWLYPALPWGSSADSQHMKRGRKFLEIWDVGLFVCLLYVAVMVPYASGFGQLEELVQACTLNGDLFFTIRFVADVCVDAFFIVDIILNFHIARWSLVLDGQPHWELIDDLPAIRARYLRTDFVIDVVGQIPWQYSVCLNLGDADVQGVMMLRLLRLLKLFRLNRMYRVINALKRQYPVSKVFLTSFELLLTTVLVGHWICCFWYFVGVSSNGWVVEEGIYTCDDVLGNCTKVSSLMRTDGTEEDVQFFEWITSLYWAMTTMTTIGYGDITAKQSSERAFAIVIMIMGSASFAWFTGRITQLLTSDSKCVSRFHDKMDEIREYSKIRCLSKDLQDKAESYYMRRFPTERVFDEENIFRDLPVEIRKELSLELYHDIVEKCPLFASCDYTTRKEICSLLVSVYKAPAMIITKENEVPDGLYIVRHGDVDIFQKATYLFSAGPGDIFGENAILGLSTDGKRSRKAIASKNTELCFLSSDSIRHLILDFPSFDLVWRHHLTLHIAKLDAVAFTTGEVTSTEMYRVKWAHDREIKYKKLDTVVKKTAQTGLAKLMSKVGGAMGGAMAQLTPTLTVEPTGVDEVGVLRTMIRFTFMEVVDVERHFDKRWACFIMSWPGSPDVEGSAIRERSKAFRVERDAKGWIPVDGHISALIKHRYNNYDEMADFLVELLLFPESYSNAPPTPSDRFMDKDGKPGFSAVFANIVASPLRRAQSFTASTPPTTPRQGTAFSPGGSRREQDTAGVSRSTSAAQGSALGRGSRYLGQLGEEESFADAADSESAPPPDCPEDVLEECFKFPMPLFQLIQNRSPMGVISLARPFAVGYRSGTNPCKVAAMIMATEVTRAIPAQSMWRKTLARFSNGGIDGSSQDTFFRKKQRKAIELMRDNAKSLMEQADLIRARRVMEHQEDLFANEAQSTAALFAKIENLGEEINETIGNMVSGDSSENPSAPTTQARRESIPASPMTPFVHQQGASGGWTMLQGAAGAAGRAEWAGLSPDQSDARSSPATSGVREEEEEEVLAGEKVTSSSSRVAASSTHVPSSSATSAKLERQHIIGDRGTSASKHLLAPPPEGGLPSSKNAGGLLSPKKAGRDAGTRLEGGATREDQRDQREAIEEVRAQQGRQQLLLETLVAKQEEDRVMLKNLLVELQGFTRGAGHG